MKLYYLPGACSLTIHIAVKWAGLPCELHQVERDKLKSPEYLAISPLGAVPALDDDGWTLTQNVAILEYLNEKSPKAGLMGNDSPRGRAEARRWLAFINSDVHKTYSVLFGAQRYAASDDSQEELRASARKMLRNLYTVIDTHLKGRDYLAADKPCAADAYLFVTLRWARGKIDLDGLDNLAAHTERMKADPGVQAAMKEEGLE
ncbi:glutathione S-transferase family protein [Bordetella genomosp. 13]|uniref:glutathione S-transferase family protein n=1 Tax=Bordetella genomosp. 13 TaxID=463040 RepID=UPI0011A58044|nr:glutathione S-transferase N-terminal domain-containing protein [Bordetella genomosp. 13]